MKKYELIDLIIEGTCRCHSMAFEKMSELSYLVNGKICEFRPIEIESIAKNHVVDLIDIRLKSCFGVFDLCDY